MSSRQGRLWSCSLLPISSVILRVRQDIKNEDSLRLVVHPCDQTILVARDVEYCSSSNQISFAVHLFHFRRRFPIRPANHRVPGFEAGFRVRVPFPERHEGTSLDDAHVPHVLIMRTCGTCASSSEERSNG